MEGTVAWKMRKEKFHLVRQDLPAGEIDIFGMGWNKWHCQQFLPRLFRRLIAFSMIASSTSCHNILPDVRTSPTQWPDVVPRDHVRPLSRGGADVWQNVVTACRRCNHRKGDQTPEEARQELLAVPFIPTHAEYIYLSGRQILADQMEFLLSHFPRNSPLHERIGEAT